MPVSNPIRFVDLANFDFLQQDDLDEVEAELDEIPNVYAPLSHTHSDYAPTSHGHSYAPVNHIHAVSYFAAQGGGRSHFVVRYPNTNNAGQTVLDTDGRCKYFHWSGNVRFAVQVDSTWMFLNPAPSDRRFKTNIDDEDFPQRWEASLTALVNVPLVSYDWNTKDFPLFSDARESLGVIAQDLELINPELVMTDPNGFKHIDVPKTIPYLVAAFKAINRRLELIENQLSN
ncbi:MAG: tail fiber domain-containing protein [Cyanobacteria bacterium P01_C01_bin.120]